jgi:hypothetical protein
MDTKKATVYKRLWKKFDALRATLPDDERDVFDTIISPEVEAHKLSVTKKAMKRMKNAAEVQANKLSVTRKPAKRMKNAAEVAAHKLSVTRKPARRQKKAA